MLKLSQEMKTRKEDVISMSSEKKFKLKTFSQAESDANFLSAHAIMYSESKNEQVKFVERSRFSDEVKELVKKQLNELDERLTS